MKSATAPSHMTSLASLRAACVTSVLRLNPRYQMRNPVMFVVYISAILSSIILVHNLFYPAPEPLGFTLGVSFWLWFTSLFANFAEAIAEGKGRAQAETLKKARRDIEAKKFHQPPIKTPHRSSPPAHCARAIW